MWEKNKKPQSRLVRRDWGFFVHAILAEFN